MPLFAAGLRYTTAHLCLREQAAFVEAELPALLDYLGQQEGVSEAFVLSTCNRVELYLQVATQQAGQQAMLAAFLEFKQLNLQEHPHAWFTFVDEAVAKHLFSVACGLDSLILGEGQILGQIKEALRQAQQAGQVGPTLHKLVTKALEVGKAVRSKTGISARDASVSKAALAKAEALLSNLYSLPIAVVGGGKMAQLILERLSQVLPKAQRKQVRIINRSPNRLDDLCQCYGFEGHTWEGVEATVAWAQVVFVATGAPHLLLGPQQFEGRTLPCTVFDLSVPRNVDPAVGELPQVHLLNTDDLAGYQGFSPEKEQQLRDVAGQWIEEACHQWAQWQQERALQSPLHQFRAQWEASRQKTLAALPPNHPLKANPQVWEAVEAWSRTWMNQALHEPTLSIKSQSTLSQAETLASVLAPQGG